MAIGHAAPRRGEGAVPGGVAAARCSESAMFKEIHPILGTRDIQRAIEFYTQKLGFQLAFTDETDPPNYVGFRRDAVELHMQFQFEYEMATTRLRVLVENPDALIDEYRQRGVECTSDSARVVRRRMDAR
jgi:catechol 2,3-dioxygenase-like lactoylglutathione lyase family enzyme